MHGGIRVPAPRKRSRVRGGHPPNASRPRPRGAAILGRMCTGRGE
jgi:hypothetical protein